MRCVVVGASAAGISCAKTLRELNKDVEITLISKMNMWFLDVYCIIILKMLEVLTI